MPATGSISAMLRSVCSRCVPLACIRVCLSARGRSLVPAPLVQAGCRAVAGAGPGGAWGRGGGARCGVRSGHRTGTHL